MAMNKLGKSLARKSQNNIDNAVALYVCAEFARVAANNAQTAYSDAYFKLTEPEKEMATMREMKFDKWMTTRGTNG